MSPHLAFIEPVGHPAPQLLGSKVWQGEEEGTSQNRSHNSQYRAPNDVLDAWGMSNSSIHCQ